MSTFEKFFFWAGIIESVFIICFFIGAMILTREERIRRNQEEWYRGKPDKIERDNWPEWKDKK